MPKTNSITKTTKSYKHLNKTDRENIERWLKEGKSQSEISRLLDRDRSTISREIKKGTITQIKQINGYEKEVEIYYADTGQVVYDNNCKRSKSKGLQAFSKHFWNALKEANENSLFSGKNCKYNIKTFIVVYQLEYPLEKIRTYRNVYN